MQPNFHHVSLTRMDDTNNLLGNYTSKLPSTHINYEIGATKREGRKQTIVPPTVLLWREYNETTSEM